MLASMPQHTTLPVRVPQKQGRVLARPAPAGITRQPFLGLPMSIFQPALSRPSLGGTRLIRLALVLPLLLAITPARAQMEPQIGREPPRDGAVGNNPSRTLKLSP